jgi:hypothetical protein
MDEYEIIQKSGPESHIGTPAGQGGSGAFVTSFRAGRQRRSVSTRGTRAAASDAGHWISSPHIARNEPRESSHFSPTLGRLRLHRE